MRVLYLVTDDWFFWSHRVGLARAARDAGAEVIVATSEGDLRERIEAEGFSFEPVAFGRNLLGQVKNLALINRLTQLYRQRRPDLVHHVSFLPIFYGAIAARRAGVPAVVQAVTGLGRLFIDGRRTLLRRTVERAYRRSLSLGRAGERVRPADGAETQTAEQGGGEGQPIRCRALFQNPDDAELFLELGLLDARDASVVFGSGVDLERFPLVPEGVDPQAPDDTEPPDESGGAPRILLCSRMLRSKGVGELVSAGRLLRERGVPHEVVLVGEPHGDNPDSVPAATLQDWHRSGVVRWLGRREDVPELMRDAQIVCLPSYYREGVPLALIEGAACARPLVSTDTPGCREIVRHGLNGLLVPARSPVALADALETLLADHELRRRFGRAGRRLVEAHFSAEVVNEAILQIYRELLRAPSGAPDTEGRNTTRAQGAGPQEPASLIEPLPERPRVVRR